mmetsp:Transcript_26617/g.56245  ORF Transcript_26617/g.56245 Transcript_26617/m.56245 type:complete len:107 (+) Transcript_26617:329-649(+)
MCQSANGNNLPEHGKHCKQSPFPAPLRESSSTWSPSPALLCHPTFFFNTKPPNYVTSNTQSAFLKENQDVPWSFGQNCRNRYSVDLHEEQQLLKCESNSHALLQNH